MRVSQESPHHKGKYQIISHTGMLLSTEPAFLHANLVMMEVRVMTLQMCC